MRNSISKYILAAAAITVLSATFMSGAEARDVRDHRMCQVLDPNCRDHRGPVIVVPPPPPPPPVVVIDPPVRPMPPVEPPRADPWADNQDDYGISCGEGRSIVRQHGFRMVRAIDCDGDVYSYKAKGRHGRATVLVNMDGDIVAVNYWAAIR